MNEEFVHHALSKGPAGKDWLEQIPGIIQDSARKWSLQVLPPFKLNYNYVAPSIRMDGSEVVLKIGFPEDREFKTEIEALTVYQGEGIEQLLEVDQENTAILLERVLPGVPLSEIQDDTQATKILASVIKKLWKPLPTKNNFIPISEWTRALPDYKKRYRGKNGPLPAYLVDKAENLFEELIGTTKEVVLIHGDLHQDNILSSDRDGWLAIDPKGIAAEPAYETAAMIRNPYDKLKNNIDPNLLKNRIKTLANELQIDPTRIHQWGLAQTVLSAVWSTEDSIKGWEHAIAVAEVLDKLKL